MDDLKFQKVITQKYVLINEQLEEQVELLIQEKENIFTQNRLFKQKATKHVRVLEMLLFMFLSLVYDNYSSYESMVLAIVIMIVAAFQESMLQNL